MERIILIETSTALCTVALAEDGVITDLEIELFLLRLATADPESAHSTNETYDSEASTDMTGTQTR